MFRFAQTGERPALPGVKPKIGTGEIKMWKIDVPLADLPISSKVLHGPKIKWQLPTIR